jgi:hypothetical protein
MLEYLFVKQVPISILAVLLEKICAKTATHYLIDMNAYKKMLYYGYHTAFCEELKTYYHKSKHYYLEREFTYNSFTNIVRQICKSNNHHYYTELKYNHSVYTILYFITFPPTTPPQIPI